MKRGILTLLVVAITLMGSALAANDTNRFILPYFVSDAVFDPEQPRVFILPDNANELNVVNLETRATRQLPLSGSGEALVMSPDGKRLYVAAKAGIESGVLAVFDRVSLTLIREFDVGVNPDDIVATDSGLVIIAGTTSSIPTVSVFNAETAMLVGNVISGDLGNIQSVELHSSQSVVYGVSWGSGRYCGFRLAEDGAILDQWHVQMDQFLWGTKLFAYPDGTRLLTGTGLILTNTESKETDLKPVGSIGAFGLIESAVFDTNKNLLIAGGTHRLRFFDQNAEEPRDTRHVADVRFVGSYEDRTAVIMRHGGSLSEILFFLPRATSAAENRPPMAVITQSDDGAVFPVGWSLQVRAEGRDEDGDIEWTRIFSGTQLIANSTNIPVYQSVQIHPGTNEIYAVVRDGYGVLATSEVVRVFGNHLPQIQFEPLLTSYSSVQPVVIKTIASDQDGQVTAVRLLSGSQVIATDETAPFEFVFNPSAPGTYHLNLEAEDNLGGIARSGSMTLAFGGASDDLSRNLLVETRTNVTLFGSNVGATRQKGEPVHAGVAGGKSVWWAWRIPSFLAKNGGILTLDTLGSDFDTVIAVYSGGEGTADFTRLKLLAANDDDMTDPPASGLKLFVSGSDVLYIAVDGREGVSGNIRLRLNFAPTARPTNDNFAYAGNLANLGAANNFGATKEAGELLHAGNSGGASVWWRLFATNQQPLRISTSGSSFDTLLAIYTTNTPGYFQTVPITNLVLVAANDDESVRSRTSELTFVAPKAGHYWIAVDGYNGVQGTIRITASRVEGTTAANDYFEDAAELKGSSVLTNRYNLSATMEPDEPFHAGKTNAAGSVWYKWTAPTGGLVSVSTRGSDFDTLLAVYTGSGLTNLNPVVSNDDDPANAPTSGVIFKATAETQYYIAVAGYGAARGEIVLALNQTPGFSPRLLTQWQQGKLWLNLSGASGVAVLESSTNLIEWEYVQMISGDQVPGVALTVNQPQQFYRIRVPE